MTTRTIVSKVAGVTYEGRQSIIALLRGDEPCRIVPEPTNAYDPNALAVHIATSDGVKHVGFIPRELAKQIAPLLEGEAVMVRILEITGGFETGDGEIATYGLRIAIDVPADQPITPDRG
jgi:single-stranded-DNA-specific exonuclease